MERRRRKRRNGMLMVLLLEIFYVWGCSRTIELDLEIDGQVAMAMKYVDSMLLKELLWR